MAYSPPDSANLTLEFADNYKVAPGGSVNLDDSLGLEGRIRQAGGISTEQTPLHHIRLSASFVYHANNGRDTSYVQSPSVDTDTPKIKPAGIAPITEVGTPEYVRWRRFLQPLSINEIITNNPVRRVNVAGIYTVPNGENLNLSWFGEPYAHPDGLAVNLEFGAVGYGKIFELSSDSLVFGELKVGKPDGVLIDGFSATGFGISDIQNLTRTIYINGINVLSFGDLYFKNAGRQLNPSGTNETQFGELEIYNLKQILYSDGKFLSEEFGEPYAQGGVKHVSVNGAQNLIIDKPTIKNATETQYATPKSITPLLFGTPYLDPYFIYCSGFNGFRVGTGYFVQHSPMPKGYDTSAFGESTIEFSLKYLNPVSFEIVEPVGSPKIRDRAEKIQHLSDQQITTIFGDTRARLSSAYIRVEGSQLLELSDWGTIKSTRRYYDLKGFSGLGFGETDIANKTPSLFYNGIDGLDVGNHLVAYSIRYIYQKESISYLGIGQAKLDQTPSLHPQGFEGFYGNAWLSHRVREVELENFGEKADAFGKSLAVDFKQRFIDFNGAHSNELTLYGKPELTYDVRYIEEKGHSDHKIGGAWISYGLRIVTVEGMPGNAISLRHSISGPKQISPLGFDATQWLTRIVPEQIDLYPKGFSNLLDYGNNIIDNFYKITKPLSFSTDSSLGNRWGYTSLVNKRQIVTQNPDEQSELAPPVIGRWNAIENRNKEAPMTGTDMQRFGRSQLIYGARLIEPKGKNYNEYGDFVVTHWTRSLTPESIDLLSMSRWSVVLNIADILSPGGVDVLETSSQSSIENRSRLYSRIGDYDTSEIGKPFISDAIRYIVPRELHSINPPRIELPKVELHTRYIEDAKTKDELHVSSLFARIHWNIITTRWSFHPPAFVGEPALRNLTPEIYTRGKTEDEYGDNKIRTQWRRLRQSGGNNNSFGLQIIRDRTSFVFQEKSIPFMVFGELRAVRIGGIPDPQTAMPVFLDYDGMKFGETFVGAQEANLDKNGIDACMFGNTDIYANSIMMELGIISDRYGVNTIQNMRRFIDLNKDNEEEEEEYVGKPTMSPHLIFAPNERPEGFQPPDNAHYVDFDRFGKYLKGIGENLTVGLKNRVIRASGIVSMMSQLQGRSLHKIQNSKTYVPIQSFNSMRMGLNVILPHNIQSYQRAPEDALSIGNHSIEQEVRLEVTQEIVGKGFESIIIGENYANNYHRAITPDSDDLLEMGQPVEFDRPYMWQGLRIGKLMPTIPHGFESGKHSEESWISFFVREIVVDGYDAFTEGMDITSFDGRMSVHIPAETIPPSYLEDEGFGSSRYGTPDIRNHVHHIRPDGNAEQYRKGVQHA